MLGVLTKVWLWLMIPIRYLIRVENRKSEQALRQKLDGISKRLDALARKTAQVDARVVNLDKKTAVRLEEQLIRYSLEGMPLTPLHGDEPIRVAFLFDSPEHWPSLESVWKRIADDPRFTPKLFLCEKKNVQPRHAHKARRFLEASGLDYCALDTYDMHAFRPHICMYQGPWQDSDDFGVSTHRMRMAGSRVAYIQYGVESAAAPRDEYTFSQVGFASMPWRFFLLSQAQKIDCFRLSPHGAHRALVTGLPRFDAYRSGWKKEIPAEAETAISGRPVVFCNLHAFDRGTKGNNFWATVADIEEYRRFFRNAGEYADLFFWVRPHPCFASSYKEHGFGQQVDDLFQALKGAPNVWLDENPDYRPGLIRSDCMISDHSSLVLDALVLSKPVLVMDSIYYNVRTFSSLLPLYDACYHGTMEADMRRFIEVVIRAGRDYKKEDRADAVNLCIPALDGNSAQRVVDALATEMEMERQPADK